MGVDNDGGNVRYRTVSTAGGLVLILISGWLFTTIVSSIQDLRENQEEVRDRLARDEVFLEILLERDCKNNHIRGGGD